MRKESFKLTLAIMISLWTTLSYAASEISTEVKSVFEQFHAALKAGDETVARSFLANDLMVLESGHIQNSAAEYAAGHMKSDMAFLKDMNKTILEQHINVFGDTAIISTLSKLSGQYKGRAYDRKGLETMVLRKVDGRWLIVHLHWS